ncbi:MAG: ATP-dependent zinc metalloprotease FtsH [Solirubrobacteraceae bacterium]|nr:ATP-dependent zinc metalloprotease FtsH [Solirubrobacteraceae bacterium]
MVPRQGRRMLITVFLTLLAVNVVFALVTGRPSESTRVPYSPFFLEQVRKGNVKEISSTADTIDGRLDKSVAFTEPGAKAAVKVTHFKTQVPTFVNTDALSKSLEREGVVLNARPPDTGRNPLLTFLLAFGPTILIIGGFLWLMRRASNMGGAGGLGAFTRSRAKLSEPGQQRVTFSDVAGIDEAEDELLEIVDFLKRPERYSRLGARVPRGVLLYGPPGTGKTLLARAVAGEANVPFFSSSASEFVEAIVGVGASRVRDMFKQAKESGPAIVFIDELDAIGRSRSAASGIGGGNDEREQTLNQILTEMDGFEGDSGVIVIAATNRPDALDKALLRPGRFDRRIAVQPPDKVGREAILRIHTRGMPLDDEIDLGRIAATTPGMTGADLALLANEAALFAARHDRDAVLQRDFTEAIEKVVLGAERQVVMSDSDRRRTAYHEAGHALVGMLTPGADPVRKVSIIPRGQALGVTLSTPDADRYGYEREELLGRIRVMLGGRAAERVIFGETTTGAESDIQQLTRIARSMVARWGMSDAVGAVAVAPASGDGLLLPGVSETSEHTQRVIDDEVRRIVDEQERETLALLERERERLDALAVALLARETLDQDEAYAVAGVEAPVAPEPAERPSRPEGDGSEPVAVAAGDAPAAGPASESRSPGT